MKLPVKKRELSILLTSILVGFLILLQARSFTDFTDTIGRDTRADVFREIQILKKTNENLEQEIADLEFQLANNSDKQQALEALKKEIANYNILTGRVAVTGPGVSLEINGNVPALWLVDITNELFSAGAEAVSVNSIRLTNTTNGFDTIPNGQLLLNGVILKQPYHFEAIGDKKTLQEALQQPQGILDRLSQSVKGVEVKLEQKDVVGMEKVL